MWPWVRTIARRQFMEEAIMVGLDMAQQVFQPTALNRHATILRDVTIRFNEMRALKRTLADVARTSTNIA
jgi:hypothetical protein